MSNYYEYLIPSDEATRELLVAELAEVGFSAFEETETELKAYIAENESDENEFNNIVNKYKISYSKSVINKKNWNQVWESNFEPVQVDDFVGIRASFHPSLENVIHEIVITPKMSFGTGHHATTFIVMQLMREIDFQDRSVFDFGTGTGILAILAEKLGASKVLAVDNDDWCIENASENILVNSSKCIDIQKIESLNLNNKYDVILANINKHIILANLQILSNGLTKSGQLVLSGLLKEDEVDILEASNLNGLSHLKTIELNGWIACLFEAEIL